MEYIKFSSLKGKVLVDIKVKPDEIVFISDDGSSYKMLHEQDCCESVCLDDVVGDFKDLLGTPLLMAEESTNHDNPPKHADSFMWTFYKLATIKGYVDLKWLGESNGYYSESVSIVKGKQYNAKKVNELMEKNGLISPTTAINIYDEKINNNKVVNVDDVKKPLKRFKV